MDTESVQELIESALESSIDALDLVATDDRLNERLREVQELCNRALVELRGFGYEASNNEFSRGEG